MLMKKHISDELQIYVVTEYINTHIHIHMYKYTHTHMYKTSTTSCSPKLRAASKVLRIPMPKQVRIRSFQESCYGQRVKFESI